MTIIIMGVAGSGKSTVGSLLASKMAWAYLDADDFHSASNLEKMGSGIPLGDPDRLDWLLSIRDAIAKNNQLGNSVVLACSALKESYREMLKIDPDTRFVYLKGSYAQIKKRLERRPGHFMSSKMLSSQYEILEEPEYALRIDISKSPAQIVSLIRQGFSL